MTKKKTNKQKSLKKFEKAFSKAFGKSSTFDHQPERFRIAFPLVGDVRKLDKKVEDILKESGLNRYFEEGASGADFEYRDITFYLKE